MLEGKCKLCNFLEAKFLPFPRRGHPWLDKLTGAWQSGGHGRPTLYVPRERASSLSDPISRQIWEDGSNFSDEWRKLPDPSSSPSVRQSPFCPSICLRQSARILCDVWWIIKSTLQVGNSVPLHEYIWAFPMPDFGNSCFSLSPSGEGPKSPKSHLNSRLLSKIRRTLIHHPQELEGLPGALCVKIDIMQPS